MKTIKELLEYFNSSNLSAKEVLSIELQSADVENIGYKSFIDLAQIFYFKMLTPIVKTNSVILKFQKLDTTNSFHKADCDEEKYGINSDFFAIDKTKEVSFLYYYQEALKFVNLKDKEQILNLGVNKGDEFKVIKDMLHEDEFKNKEFLGIDYSNSAIEYAKNEFKNTHIKFISHDINKLHEISLKKADLLISIGTLQSSNINFNERFMDIYQNYLQKDASIILGFPNCRWIDDEMIYGAKAPNYSFNEMSLVLKDIHFCKKYLQQKKYRVVITGKDYLFLSARKIV